MYQVKIERFEGPLSLLLDLIEREKLDITEISLAQVTDQYLRIVSNYGDHIALSELADFLLLAGKLLLIKSRVLLPQFLSPEEEAGGDLERQLEIYKIYRQASERLAAVIKGGNFAFFRRESKIPLTPKFTPPAGLTAARLQKSFVRILENLRQSLNVLDKKKIKSIISLAERIGQLREILAGEKQVRFFSFLKSARSRTEIVISFLALLELIKQKEIFVKQSEGDIYVNSIKN